MTQILHGGKPITGGMHVRTGTTQSYRARLDHYQTDPANKFLFANGRHATAKAVGMSWPDRDDPDYRAKEMAVLTAFDDAERTGRFVDKQAANRATAINDELKALIPPDPKVNTSGARTTPSRAASGDARSYEQIPPSERVQLKKTNPARFDALRASWIERGQPFQVAT